MQYLAARGVPLGDHWAELRATWKADPQKSVVTRLSVRVTDGQFVGYDPKLRLLTRAGKPLGPITGSYRGQSVFKDIGTAGESLLHGQDQWQAAIQSAPPGPGGIPGQPWVSCPGAPERRTLNPISEASVLFLQKMSNGSANSAVQASEPLAAADLHFGCHVRSCQGGECSW